MKKFAFYALLVAVVVNAACAKSGSAGSSQSGQAVQAVAQKKADINYTQLLTVEEVSQVSGIQGLKFEPKDQSKRRMGELNFVKADDKDVLIVNVMPVRTEEHDKYREQYKKYKYAEVNGFGDLAFIPTQKIMNITVSQFIFIKGTWSVILTSSIDPTSMKNYFSLDDLKKLAGLILSRI